MSGMFDRIPLRANVTTLGPQRCLSGHTCMSTFTCEVWAQCRLSVPVWELFPLEPKQPFGAFHKAEATINNDPAFVRLLMIEFVERIDPGTFKVVEGL